MSTTVLALLKQTVIIEIFIVLNVKNYNILISKFMKKTLITGITGQDGSYLAEFLLKKIILYMASKENLPPLIRRIDQIYNNKSFKNKFSFIMETLLTLIQ